MSWAVGFDKNWNRDIGYGVPAECDHPDCHNKIDRGLAYVCGGEPYGGENGCGLYFCEDHLIYAGDAAVCERCAAGEKPFEPKPDVDEWIKHKETDPSWEEWRNKRRELFLAKVDELMKNRSHYDIIRDTLSLLKANWYGVWPEEIDDAYDSLDAIEAENKGSKHD